MKFFHLSDLHIGLRLHNRDLLEDQEYILQRVCGLARDRQPDAVIIAGDIYDRAVPSAEAVTLFDRFMLRLTQAVPRAAVMMISGNHDSAPRLDLYRGILRRQGLYAVGLPPQTPEEHIEVVTLKDDLGPVDFYLLPFVKPSMVRAIVGTREDGSALSYDEALHRLIQRDAPNPLRRSVLVSHQFYLPAGTDADGVERMESEQVTVGNIDAVKGDLLTQFDYAALGHIHKPMKVGGDAWRYCGTPLACSVSEAGQKKGVIEVELGAKGQVSATVLPLVPLREVKVLTGLLEDVLAQACDDYVSVRLTDRTDLDVLDMQDRLRAAFPHLLDIQRTYLRQANYDLEGEAVIDLDPFSLCAAFLGDLDAEETDLLRDAINTVKEDRT